MTYRKSSHSSKRSQFPDVFLTIACRELSLFFLAENLFQSLYELWRNCDLFYALASHHLPFSCCRKKKRTSACIALRVRNKEGKKQQGIFVMASFARRTLTCLVLDASTFCYFFLFIIIYLFVFRANLEHRFSFVRHAVCCETSLVFFSFFLSLYNRCCCWFRNCR